MLLMLIIVFICPSSMKENKKNPELISKHYRAVGYHEDIIDKLVEIFRPENV